LHQKDFLAVTFYTKEPQAQELKAFISYYYFHECDDPKSQLSFSYYPHFRNALTLYKGSKAEILGPTYSKVTPKKNASICAYTQIHKHFAKAEIHGVFQKIGIVFEPLGINNFIDCPLSDIVTQELNMDFPYFKDAFAPIQDTLFSSPLDEKVTLLDQLFLQNKRPFDETRMYRALDLLFAEGEKKTVQEISEELNVSRKTLLRLFKKHLNCTVQDYASLIQFRHSVEAYQKAAEKPSFTGLALDLNYYDQSDFVHHFKRITNTNPKKFFDSLKEFGEHDTFWSPK
jgi:AraC-like DNA-binding protein